MLCSRSRWLSYFNPRTPCGVRLVPSPSVTFQSIISIHAPRAGCDAQLSGSGALLCISIHAPRAGCDLLTDGIGGALQDFNPRTPCGVRRHMPARASPRSAISIHAPRAGCDLALACVLPRHLLFQSTHPVRGATANLTVLPGQICAKGTKKSLFSRKNAQKRK